MTRPVLIAAAFLLFASCIANAVGATPFWKPVQNRMTDGRWAPASCALSDGTQAIIAGGYSYSAKRCVATIDLYDEATNRFRRSRARLAYPADFSCANRLSNGDVLITGGFSDVWASLKVAQLYNPATDSCRLTRGQMMQHRELFQAVTLQDGTVLITGGLDLWKRSTLRTAEIYHPTAETFTRTAGAMVRDRFGHAACRLSDGRVLVVGGVSWNLKTRVLKVLDSAEIYDPATQQFHTARGHLDIARDRPTATLLPSGKVLIYGGQGPGGAPVTSAELFDPQSELFTAVPGTQTPRMAHCAAALPGSGTVVICGGWDAATNSTTATSLEYEPRTGQFMVLPDLPFASHDQAIVIFADGAVLVAGGKVAVGRKASSNDEGALLSFGEPRLGKTSGPAQRALFHPSGSAALEPAGR